VGLEALARVVGRQKQMAYDIGSEVESQNGLHRFIHRPIPPVHHVANTFQWKIPNSMYFGDKKCHILKQHMT